MARGKLEKQERFGIYSNKIDENKIFLFDLDFNEATEDEHNTKSLDDQNSYGYSVDEIGQLKTLQEEDNVIQEQLKILDQRMAEIHTSINAIKKKADPELQELLNPLLNQNKRHTITCVSIREEKQLKIIISSCDKPREIERFFDHLLKTKCQVKRNNTSKRFQEDSEIVVTIKLSEREHLIEGLKLSEEVLNLPSSHRYLDGC